MAKATRKARGGRRGRGTKRRTASRPVRPAPAARRAAAAPRVPAALRIPPPERIEIVPPVARRLVTAAEAGAPLAVAAGAAPKAQTIIYVHGIGNKPIASVLKCQWDQALFGVKLGDRSRMTYWVNREYYPKPESTTCADADRVQVDTEEITTHTVMALARGETPEAADPIRREIRALATDDSGNVNEAQAAWLARIAERVTDVAELSGERAAADVSAKILPLPAWARERVARGLTRVLLRDVNDFMFDAERRRTMTESLAGRAIRHRRAQPGHDDRL
jgi:hypothetical protein